MPTSVMMGGSGFLGTHVRLCDLYVLPSEAEGFPLMLQEAMASGLPIVTTDDPRYGAQGLDRDDVLLVEPTVSAITGALTNLTDDPNHRKAMARYSSKLAQRNFGREQHIERLRSLREEALRPWGAKATSSHAVVSKTGRSRRDGR